MIGLFKTLIFNYCHDVCINLSFVTIDKILIKNPFVYIYISNFLNVNETINLNTGRAIGEEMERVLLTDDLQGAVVFQEGQCVPVPHPGLEKAAPDAETLMAFDSV